MLLILAVTAITLALVFYTFGVWGERIQKTLKPWHLVLFWLGLMFDTTGTTLMGELAGGGFKLNFHGVTGVLAIALMLFHAVWASWVLAKGSDETKARFHRFSLFVWIVWLIPFVSGMVFAMAR
jgi:uncharacterized repeat protein (TIGR03987 family)